MKLLQNRFPKTVRHTDDSIVLLSWHLFEMPPHCWIWMSHCFCCRCDKDIKVSYTVYNRLSVLLKSLLAITRVTPAYKLSRKQGHDYVILYRWGDSLTALFGLLLRWVDVWRVSPSVSASLIPRIYFGEVQLSGLGEGNLKLCFLTDMS